MRSLSSHLVIALNLAETGIASVPIQMVLALGPILLVLGLLSLRVILGLEFFRNGLLELLKNLGLQLSRLGFGGGRGGVVVHVDEHALARVELDERGVVGAPTEDGVVQSFLVDHRNVVDPSLHIPPIRPLHHG